MSSTTYIPKTPKKSLLESIPLTEDVREALEEKGYTIARGRATYTTDIVKEGDLVTHSHQLPDTLDLSRSQITDISSLKHVKDLDLRGCNSITDLTPLGEGNVRILVLRGCTGIYDVSALGGVETLILEGCTGVVDVSALRGVYWAIKANKDVKRTDSSM